jgi:hypothetical protein
MNQLALSTDLICRNQSKSLSQSETVKHTYLDKRVITSQSRRAKTRSAGAQSRLQTKKHLVTLACEISEVDLAHKVSICHSRVAVLTCGQHIAKVIPNHTCEFRLCPDCSRRRQRKHFNNYLPKATAFAQVHHVEPVHLVLTQTHRTETFEQSVKRLLSAFRKLVRRKFWLAHFKGGLWDLEVTIDANGLYHTHLHLLAFRTKFFDVALLRSEWLAVTGDSMNFHIDRVSDIASGLREVMKYIAKPLDINRFKAQNLRDFLEIKGMRFFGTFGEFQKFCAEFAPSDNDLELSDLDGWVRDLVEGCACPRCDNPLFEVRLSADELPYFLQQIEKSTRSKSPPS